MLFEIREEVVVVKVSERLSKTQKPIYFVKVVNPVTYDTAEFIVSAEVAKFASNLKSGQPVKLLIDTEGRFNNLSIMI